MKRSEAINLNVALSNQGLKVKNLSGANYFSLICLKKPLAKYLNEMAEDEQTLLKDHGVVTQEDLSEKLKDKSFSEKWEAIHAKDFEVKELNFIPLDEFKKFTDEVEFSVGAILAEYLLKE